MSDELAAVHVKDQLLMSRSGPLLERLMAYFKSRYGHWTSEPRLARPALRETAEFPTPAPLDCAEAPADEVASLVFGLYLVEVWR